MRAADAFQAGRLREAVALQDATCQQSPEDPQARLFLVELLTLAGEYLRAWEALRSITCDDPSWPETRRRLKDLVRAAYHREQGRKPTFPDDCPQHLRDRWRAVRALRRSDFDRAIRWIDRADASTPWMLGHIDGREFQGLRDVDDRFAPLLEVYLNDLYCWWPWEMIRKLTILPSQHPLDLAIRTADVELRDGTSIKVMIPVVYPGSFDSDEFALGQEHDSIVAFDPLVVSIGAKELLIGEEEVIFAECQQIEIRPG